MAFEIINDSYAQTNELIDAMAAAWDWDSTDLESTCHSVTWGDCRISGEGAYLVLYHGSAQVAMTTFTSSPTTFTIVKASNAVLIIYRWGGGAAAIAATTGTSAGGNQTTKLAGITQLAGSNGLKVGGYAFAGGTGGYSAATVCHVRVTEFAAAQVTPYMHTGGGFLADNAGLCDVMDSADKEGRISIGGEAFYVAAALGIKEV